MKSLILICSILVSVTASANPALAVVWPQNEQAIRDILGFDESVIKIEGYEMNQDSSGNLTIKTDVVSYYSREEKPAAIQCFSVFQKSGSSYLLLSTKCQLAPSK